MRFLVEMGLVVNNSIFSRFLIKPAENFKIHRIIFTISCIHLLGRDEIVMNQLKKYTIIGTLFVLITGTFSHFIYEWSGNNYIVGFFCPVNESTWEHMKLVFFPMLLYTVFMYKKLHENYPCILSYLSLGILIGTFLIPVIFYTYTGILGYNIFILDIATFALSVILAFCSVYKLTLSHKLKACIPIFFIIVFAVLVCFIIFTYHPPQIGLFAFVHVL